MRLPGGASIGLSVAGLLWSAFIGAGFFCVLQYEATPGDADVPPAHWPAATFLVPQRQRVTLVLAAHPRCPCTRATIDELAELLAQEPAKIVAHVLVFKPANCASGWEQTDIWRRVAAIPGATVRADDDGAEAKRFGLRTSGHALLYDAKGRLVFSGGLTNARGHAGVSIGRQAITGILNDAAPVQTTTPVFGCSLVGADAPAIERCSQCQP